LTTTPINIVTGDQTGFAATVLECSPDCLKVLDSSGNVLFFNVNGLCAMEIDDFGQVAGAFWPTLWPDQALAKGALEQALSGIVGSFRGFCPTAKGTPKWWDVIVTPVPNEDGPIERLIVISRDITAQRAAEERQATLTAELGHRINNTLTVVMAMAAQTRRATTDVKSFHAAFSTRLKAMSDATTAIIQGKWEGAFVRDLAETQLNTFLTSDNRRITLNGPDVLVPSEHAQLLALMLNELATNATKYGALSNKTGTVTLNWAPADNARALKLEWREQGGPPVTVPTRTGSGSALLNSGVSGPEVDLRYEPGGVVCIITLPF